MAAALSLRAARRQRDTAARSRDTARGGVGVNPALAGLEPVSKHPGPGEQQSHIDELHLSRTIAIAQT